MSQQAFADIAVDVSLGAHMLSDYVSNGLDDATNGLEVNYTTFTESLQGDSKAQTEAAANTIRLGSRALVTEAGFRSVMGSVFQELASTTEVDLDVARLGTDPSVFWDDLFGYFVDNNHHVTAPGHTYDTTATAGAGNTGDGDCLRLTVDEEDGTLWGLDPDTYTVRCIADARTTGKAHLERWEVKGTRRFGAVELEMEPVVFQTLTGANNQGSPLKNPGFDSASGTTTITRMPGWRTQTDGASAVPNSNIESVTTPVFGPTIPGATTSKAIKFTADEILYQDFVIENSRGVFLDRPYVIAVRVHRVSTATGNLILRVSSTLGSGGISATLDVSTLTADTWDTHYLDAGDVGQDCWPARWNANDLKLQIEADTLSGEVVVDQVIFCPMTRFGQRSDTRRGRGSMGQYVSYVSGETAAVATIGSPDDFTFTDTESTRGEVQWSLRKGAIGYLPAVADATQVTASGGRTLTFADANPDTITASSGDFTSDGYQLGMTLTVAGTSSNNGTYTINGVSATVITLIGTDTLAAEGPLSATATLDATASIPDQ